MSASTNPANPKKGAPKAQAKAQAPINTKKLAEVEAEKAEALKRAAEAEEAKKKAQADTAQMKDIAQKAIAEKEKETSEAILRQKKTTRNLTIALAVLFVFACVGGYFAAKRLNEHFESKYTTLQVETATEAQKAQEAAADKQKALLEDFERAKKQLAEAELGSEKAKKLELELKEKEDLIAEQRRIAKETADKVSAEKAANEAKLIAEKAAAAERELVELKELEAERTRAIDRLKSETIDHSKNWVPQGQIPVANKDVFNKMWQEGGGWIQFNGRYFPLLTNNHGNPAPIKGDNPPDFIEGTSNWEIREITLKNPKGSGSYTTKAWSSTTRPLVKK